MLRFALDPNLVLIGLGTNPEREAPPIDPIK